MGPGLVESIYEWCLIRELSLRGFTCEQQRSIRIEYRGAVKEEPMKCDIVVNQCLLLEIKAVEGILPVHKAQLLSYMRLLDIPLELLINFHEPSLKQGLSRMILPKANLP